MALIHWFTTSICVYDVTGLMNIQGGHSGGYISRQMGKIIVKIAKLSYFTQLSFLVLQDNHIVTDSFHHSLQVGMFCIIVSISATGLFGYLEVDLGVIVGSYWIHLLSLSQGALHL